MYVRLLTNNFLSEKAVGKSESKDVHLAVLRVLPEVIRESVDADASSKSVIMYDPATGEKKMVSPTAVDGIESLGEVKTAEQREAEINARMQDTIQRGKDWLEGNVANPVGMQIQLGDGRIATIEAMHEDGKSAIATLPDGTQFLVPKDVLQRIVNNGQYADYKARRDAEAGKREAEQGSESAPETATEGGQPLPEEASPKEEERREYAQGDVFDVVVDGQNMHAEIVSPKDADGRFVVNVDDGESMRTLYVTPEELAAMEYKEPKEEPLTESENPRTIDTEEPPISNAAPTEHTPTALERIPRDEKGNAQFHDVDTEIAWDGLVEMSGNEETAHKVAEASLANAEKRLKEAKALKEKGETPEELLLSIKENEAAVAERKAAEERERAEKEEKARIEAEKKETERIATEKAEEEARVEAERKAEEERIAKQKAEEKTEEAESDKEEAEKQMDDEEPKPVGSGVFGNIYNQFKGKVKEAFDFLMKHKGGDLLGVFHRKDVGDIDLVWGDENGGLAHILNKHVGEGKSFANVDEAMSHIQNIIETGKNDFEDGDKIVFRKGSELVTVRKNFREGGKKIADKNWVLTAYDKEAADNGNRVTTKVIEGKATPHTASTGKGSEKPGKKQEKQSVFDKAKEIADKEEKKRKAEADKPKQKPLTEAERKDAEEVAGALGYRVEWVDTMEENGTIDADKKVIRIAKDAENPLVQVLGHEVAHGVKRMDGGKFRTLQKAAMEVVGEKEWNERIEKKRKLNAYAEGKLAEEVTCDIVGEALNDKDALKRLAESLRGEKGILARLRDAVARMVEYFKNRGDKEGVRRMKAADRLLAEFESALKKDVASGQANPEGVDRSVRESEDEPENKRRKDFAERFGVDESYVSDYANGMAQKSTGKAARARRSMERQIYLADDGKTSKLSDIAKRLKPFRAALKEAFGDLDALIDEYRKLFEEERNMMEAARKKAEEEAAARKRHLDELSLLTDGQIDNRYAEALEKGDETEAREMLDEVARRKGYGDENNEYRMQHRAPSNPGYESDEARRNDIENGPDVNLEDIALGYNRQPDDYFTNPRGYGNDTPHGRESTDAVANALSSIRQGGRDVTVKVYRAVPTTMKEGKLRNGDWVSLSRRYAEMHGNHALNGKYRIMEDEVPAKDIWWDGNDVNEFGYDNGEDYKYKNVKNNRKSDDLVTRDDKGNVIPPSKRFNQRKADERYSRRESKALTAEERELRDNLVERMRKGGLDVVTDSEEMQRVIDTENERTRNKRSKKSEAARKRDEALYAVDWSTAFVSGKSREEATEIRRERGRKFKEETKELYGRVLSGNFDDVTLRLIDEFIDKSTPNNPYERPISKRLPARALQKMRGRERTGSIDALFSRISESAVGKDGKALPRAERERAIEEKKKELLKKWAIATGNWHTDIADFTDQREPIGSGTDSDVYLGKDGKSVIKVSKGKPYGKRFRPDVDNVALFNTVFPGSRYTIEGYGEIDGKFVRFLKQPIVDFTSSTPLTEGERVAYMEKLGFKPINKENTAFSNGEIIASDLQKSNIVKDKQGNVRVIDADMKLHTKDVGGNYSYPDVETDTTGLAEREEVNTGSVREHRVYHGSGADFDAFDHSHMGEGEGAQAYGWGTYVTEVEGIGRTYAVQNSKYAREYPVYNGDSHGLSEGRINEILEVFLDGVSDETYILRAWDDAMQWYSSRKDDDYAQSLVRDASLLNPSDISIAGSKTRNLYTVEIPDDNGSNYLDWNGHPAESLLKDVGLFLESNGFERVQDNPVRYEKGESTVVLNPNATGADLYAELQEALGGDKKASQALAESGCIGIKYPADNMRGGRKDGAKNYVIFNENDAKITDHTRFLRTAGGDVYGLVKDGRIYLDPKVATSETAVHEYTHLWGDMLRRKDSEQWSHTVKELKNSVLWEEVKESYPELKTDDEIADEVLSTFSGRRGAERLREEARRVADGDGGVFTKAKAIETLERVKEAIARFWEGVARMFGINRYRSAEELADMAMKDLLDSKNPMKDESGMRKRGEVGETLATSGTYFSGGGLLEAGLKGVIDPKVAVEFSEKIAGVYADNHGNHIVVADVRDVDPKKLVGAVDGGEVQYFHASPVCKNFSKAKREGGEVELDKETALSTAEFIAKTRPKVVTIENVKGYRNSEALKIITDELTRQGYDWDADVYNAADYGGYTKRERLIVRAKRDGKLPPKPEKLPEELRKKGWYSAVEDLIPHLEEKKTGVPQGTDERLKNSGIDYRTIDKPLYVFGRGYANKTVGHAFADELLPTLTTGGGDIIIMPDGRVLKASPRVLARVTGLPDTYKMPETDQLSHTIVGNGIPTQLTEGVIAPLLDNAIPSAERATKRESVFDVADRVSQNLEERTRAMGSRVEKRMADVAQKLEGKELSMEQKAVVDVFSGKSDNQKFSVKREDGKKQTYLLKQGNEEKAGAKHSLYRHYGTNSGVITADDVLKIPQVLERGERTEKAKGGKKMAVYTMDVDGAKYIVLTRVGKNNEIVDDFYSNKEGSESSVYRNAENIDNTPEGARRKDSEPSAKVEDKPESPKLFGEEIIDDGKKGSDSIDRSVRENPKNEDKPRLSRKPGESIFDYASRVSDSVDRSVREIVSARDEYEKKVKSKGFQTKEALQNSMLGLQEFMYAIDHASGNKRYIEDIPDFENPILGENRLSSVNKEEMHQVAKTQFKPLMSAVAKLSGNGKESGELYDYMFAKHGLERDAVMRQREAQKEFDKYQKANPKGTKTIGDFVASLEGKDYAGLTALTAEDGRVKSIQSQIDTIDEQMKATDDQLLLRNLGGQKKRLKVDLLNAARDAADDIRKAFESNPSHDRSDINELWKRVNEVNGNTLRKLYESGLLTKEAYDDISSMYTNYIPMRGFDQTTSADAYAYLTHGDSAFNAPIKTAKGRSSKADNPIAYMQAMAESAIMQGNRNVLVKQKMLNFVRNHPSDLASVSDVWLQYDSVADEWKPVYAFGRESKG